MPHSGPYTLVQWDANQKIYDLRSDWWAVKAGRIAEPAVKRIVMVNIGGQVGQNMDIVIQRLVNNEMDAILDVRASVAKQILDSNDKITTHSGSDAPYGYLDWWPNSLWSNTQIEPFSDPNVRRAMCDTIDRNTINEIV
jgi:ABC-type transport system substrate-binding protein